MAPSEIDEIVRKRMRHFRISMAIMACFFGCLYMHIAYDITPKGSLNTAFIMSFFLTIAGVIVLVWELLSFLKKGTEVEKLKIGLDIHGVIDADPEFFSVFSRMIINSNHEIHVLTGKHIKDGVLEELNKYNIVYTKLFSIADYHKENGTPMRYDDKGTPWIDNELWNKTKAKYCADNNIHLCIDDSKNYGQYFITSYAQATIFKRLKSETK